MSTELCLSCGSPKGMNHGPDCPTQKPDKADGALTALQQEQLVDTRRQMREAAKTWAWVRAVEFMQLTTKQPDAPTMEQVIHQADKIFKWLDNGELPVLPAATVHKLN